MFRSATFKLTMWYLAIAMAISLLFSFVLYQVTSNELSRGVHRESQRIYDNFPVFEHSPMLRPGDDIEDGRHRILTRLVGINVIVLIGAGWASYLLARRTLEPIEHAHEQQKRFTADVSHELRTPLTALKMESEVALLNQKNGPKELRAALTSNLEEAGKLEALINNLLRLTQLEAGELQQHFEPQPVELLVGAALEKVQPAAENKHITITNTVKAATVAGDRDSLVQLFVILLENAIKYSPQGSKVTIKSRPQDDTTVLEIDDNGPGIDKEALEHVFDRFYRADNSRAKSIEGFGLGLSIAKMIADIHDADITLKSRPGKGTTATVTLPKTAAN